MFHRIREDFDPLPLSIKPATFQKLVDELDRNRKLVSLESGIAELRKSGQNTRYTLTFDDGYLDNLELLNAPAATQNTIIYLSTGLIGNGPIWVYKLITAVLNAPRDTLNLDHLGMGRWSCKTEAEKIEFISYVNTHVKAWPVDKINQHIDEIVNLTSYSGPFDRDRMLDWSDVNTLIDGGIDIGSHTVNHEIMTNTSPENGSVELTESAQHISDHCSKTTVPHFAYPNGTTDDFSTETEQWVRSAGYATAVTTIEGVNTATTSPYQLKRFNIDEQRCLNPWGGFSRARLYGETGGILTFLKELRST